MTKALVIADRNPRIPIYTVVQEQNIELIITLGDLLREDILDLSRINWIPKIGVYGNHDSGNYMEELGIMNLHRMTWDFNGKKYGGFEGCVRYKENPEAIMYTQQEAQELMQNFVPVDIFVSHCPPRGINDEQEVAHQGFDALRQYLDNIKPEVWMHGHTYPEANKDVKDHNGTRIEYVFGYRIIAL